MKPVIGITLGDPAGIGPEILLKSSASPLFQKILPIVFGDRFVLEDLLRRTWARRFSSSLKKLQFVTFAHKLPKRIALGRANQEFGRWSGNYLEAGIHWARQGRIQALVTLPINKVSFEKGGYGRRYRGHTEMLAALTESKATALMLASGNLRAVHVTSHIALKDVPRTLSIANILSSIQLAHQGLRMMGIRTPKLGVAALNPHAGDEGLMGMEESRIILPAIKKARSQGIKAEGPIPADVLWPQVLEGKFNAGIAMYHDQGQIAVKLLARKNPFMDGINITLGLPIVRVSPAHGTAYDIAGQGKADIQSFLTAIKTALILSQRQSFFDLKNS